MFGKFISIIIIGKPKLQKNYVFVSPPPPLRGHLWKVCVGVCRRGLEKLTLFKKKSVRFATLSKTTDPFFRDQKEVISETVNFAWTTVTK